ncbi:SRPBCC family protein [Nocardia yamanashiensis]|uniref:SRPBCC family protein n=1 Tax=Nocardia yamanashiensis TaxID=209247 RepID=UPI00082AC421|nr:SRPBCC family protein [Nocardia yamanashiensis]
MPDYCLKATVSDTTPDAVFAAIADFGRYPALVPDVIAALTVRIEDGQRHSDWAVRFHGGTLKWGERDIVDAATYRIEFQQTTGDFAEFAGSWQIDAVPDGYVRVSLAASFDLGMPDVAEILDPIALDAFDSTMRTLLTTLVGTNLQFEDTAAVSGGKA